MTDPLELAQMIAESAHCNQTYGEGQPYTIHLAEVVQILREFGHGSHTELLQAGWLHDTLEDTQHTVKVLIDCGISVYAVALVDAVTNQSGKNRAERHALTYPRIARMPDAITLKLADRIANVRAATRKQSSLLDMYRKEYPGFKDALRWKYWNFFHETSGLFNEEMWAELDRLLA